MLFSRRNRRHFLERSSNFKVLIVFFQEDVGEEQSWALTTLLSFILTFGKTKFNV